MNEHMQLSLQQARAWLSGAELVGDGITTVRRVHSDTRTLQPGDLFVALRGERFDGNQFLAQARAAGAAAALCSDAAALRAAGLPGLVVADSRRALGELARGWRAQWRLPLIAVTGSNGKTTVTQMIAAILRVFKPQAMLATEGNLNNDIGVPLTLLRLRPWHEVAVLELGMNHPGEIALLAAIAQPTVALVNNAQREHQEFMDSVEAVARENGAVITALGASGTAVFPADDAFSGLWQQLAGTRAQLTFALSDGSSAADVRAAPPPWCDGGWQLRAVTPAGELTCALHVPGLHNVRNALAATACALAVGAPLAAIAQGLQAFRPVAGRSRSFTLARAGQPLTLVDDSYNANPDSVRAAIDVLADLPAPRLLVLGDMGEVGRAGPRFHAEVGAYARARGIEHLYLLGEQSRHAAQAYGAAARHFSEVQALNAAVAQLLPQLASVLVKGSRFMRMERVVQAIASAHPHHEEAHHAH
jgi:UDP-N-acetylmuramoyl-tripeptide--D-alanyl-D-alanine ligase